MAIDPDRLAGVTITTPQEFGPRDVILYALGVGTAIDAEVDPAALRFLYEEGLQVLPSMAVVLGYPGFWLKDPQHGVDWRRVLHGEQSITLFRPLPTSGQIIGRTHIDGLFDRGRDKGAVLVSSRTIVDAASGELLARVSQTTLLRGDGGFGGSAAGAPRPRPLRLDREPDHAIKLRTRREQALIYRLSGDHNPLHVDPAVAREAGFERPILHGLCTFGVAGRAVLSALGENKPECLRSLHVRFSAPVYPGETIEVRIWRGEPGQAAVQARAVERDQIVLTHGFVEFDA